jgi:hypothetical protein
MSDSMTTANLFEAPIIVLRDNTDPAIYAEVVRAAFEFAHR